MSERDVIGAMYNEYRGASLNIPRRELCRKMLRAALKEATRMEYSEGGSPMYWLRKAIEPPQEAPDE